MILSLATRYRKKIALLLLYVFALPWLQSAAARTFGDAVFLYQRNNHSVSYSGFPEKRASAIPESEKRTKRSKTDFKQFQKTAPDSVQIGTTRTPNKWAGKWRLTSIFSNGSLNWTCLLSGTILKILNCQFCTKGIQRSMPFSWYLKRRNFRSCSFPIHPHHS